MYKYHTHICLMIIGLAIAFLATACTVEKHIYHPTPAVDTDIDMGDTCWGPCMDAKIAKHRMLQAELDRLLEELYKMEQEGEAPYGSLGFKTDIKLQSPVDPGYLRWQRKRLFEGPGGIYEAKEWLERNGR